MSGGQEVLGREGRKGPADAYCLGSGEGSYRLLYVPVAKRWDALGRQRCGGPLFNGLTRKLRKEVL